MNEHLKFGIEEEYFVTDLDSLRLAERPRRAAILACKSALGSGFAYEMHQAQIEVASPVFICLPDAAHYLADARRALRQALEPHGLGLVCTGSHPLADWRTQHATAQKHFQQLFEVHRHVAQRSVLSGLHVHVEVPAHLDRIRVMNEVLPWTPLLLALSSSSPFWDGVDSGYMSYRQTACDEWPRMGVPEFFADQAAYEAYLDLLMRNGTITRHSECWWGVRPACKYPTLELRMTDACPRLDDALCIATLFRLLVAQAIGAASPGANYSQSSRWVLSENRWRAKRYGVHASFIVEGYDQPFSAEQWLFQAERMLGEAAQVMHVEGVFAQARRILREGSSAERQRALYEREISAGADARSALARVVDQLLAETAQAPGLNDLRASAEHPALNSLNAL